VCGCVGARVCSGATGGGVTSSVRLGWCVCMLPTPRCNQAKSFANTPGTPVRPQTPPPHTHTQARRRLRRLRCCPTARRCTPCLACQPTGPCCALQTRCCGQLLLLPLRRRLAATAAQRAEVATSRAHSGCATCTRHSHHPVRRRDTLQAHDVFSRAPTAHSLPLPLSATRNALTH
jgi:hypothetical protein